MSLYDHQKIPTLTKKYFKGAKTKVLVKLPKKQKVMNKGFDIRIANKKSTV